LFSVVIPAHNEASTIARCLESLVVGSQPGELQIVVVCNGCTDATAEIARRTDRQITVIKTPIASKTLALNLGDRAASGFPRWYVDADIVVSIESMRRTNAEMERLGGLVGAPRMIVDLTDRGWPIRWYYDIWMRTPYVTQGMVGSGVFVLSSEGRRRFDRFPDVIGDDAYIRFLFDATERTSVDTATFEMRPPKSVWVLIKIRARRRISTEEVSDVAPEAVSADRVHQRSQLGRLFLQPKLWHRLLVYVLIRLAAEMVYQFRYRIRGTGGWERDDTSR